MSASEKTHQGAKEHFMHYALTLDTLRGRDSTGIIELTKKFTVRTRKSLLSGDRYVHSKSYAKNWRPAWGMIGHNRAAIAGEVTMENAHPFTFGPITLVHNGTLFNDGASLHTYDKNLEVDSMQIALALSSVTPDNAKTVLARVYGSFCLVWTDSRDNSMNMARNGDRPMHITFNAQRDVLWFMSDGLHLHTINNSMKGSTARGTTVFEIDKYNILKYKKGNITPEVTKFSPFVAAMVPAKKSGYTPPASRSPLGTGNTGRAHEKWRDHLKKRDAEMDRQNANDEDPLSSKTNETLRSMTIQVAGKPRKLLAKHVVLLKKEFDILPTERIRFKPMRKVKQDNGRFTVVGEVWLKEFEGWWDATIHDLEATKVNAYWNHEWYVNATGLGKCNTTKLVKTCKYSPSILCEYEKAIIKLAAPTTSYKKSCSDVPMAKKPMGVLPAPKAPTGEEELAERGTLYLDKDNKAMVKIGERTVTWAIAKEMKDRGCISCSSFLSAAELAFANIVNDGRDILCVECIEDLNRDAMKKLNQVRRNSRLTH